MKPSFAIALLGCLTAVSAFAYSLDPRGDVEGYFNQHPEARRHLPFLDGHAQIHERLTMLALACDEPGGACETLMKQGFTVERIIEGVRSNDFPAQYLDHNAVSSCTGRVLRITRDADVPCILGSFLRASLNKERFETNATWARDRPFGMRGHFGDLQFFHSMAPSYQTAGETYTDIKMWMEFAYRASMQEFDLRSDLFGVPVIGMNRFFVRGSRRVGDVLDYQSDPAHAASIALGQMLHIAQDGFAPCHVVRDSQGKVWQYLSYVQQNPDTHALGDNDTRKVDDLLRQSLNPVAFGKELLALRAANRPWSDVEPLVERYFKPAEGRETAQAGEGAVCAFPPTGD